MKNKIYIVLIFALLVNGSCEDLLDNSIDTNLKPEQVFVNYDRMKQVAAGAYVYLQQVGGLYQWGGSLKACATDEAEETDYSSPAQRFNLGTWNQYSNPDDVYATMYEAIRQCNLFLENTKDYKEILVIDTITTTGKDLYLKQCEDIEFYIYELRFLRAFYYFELIKRYGGVPLVKNTLTKEEGNSYGRATFDECIDFIVEEIDQIKTSMQVDWNAVGKPEDYGRATQGAALALKSRVLLYAASPLHNPTNDSNKWIEAAKAAKEVMDIKKVGSNTTPLYELSSKYQSLFVAPASYSDPEVIFYLRYANSNILEAWNYPIGTPGGKSGVTPSQNLVDAYEKLSGWSENYPYDRVDPRMQYTIVVNSSNWNGRTINSYVGGEDGPGRNRTSRTGYYLKKFLSPNLNLTGSNIGRSMKSWIFFRYAEILLNYAEAMNEAYGPDGTNGSEGLNISARSAINLVRGRSDVNLPNVAITDKDTFRNTVKRERQVELAFEEHRSWDLRRWKEGYKLAEPIRGTVITKHSYNEFSYEYVEIEKRTFDESKMYLYPIPQSEINKNPEKYSQNPGWN